MEIKKKTSYNFKSSYGLKRKMMKKRLLGFMEKK